MLLRVLILSLFLTCAATADDQAEIDGDALEAFISACQSENISLQESCSNYVTGVVDGLFLGAGAGLSAQGVDFTAPGFAEKTQELLAICNPEPIQANDAIKHIRSYIASALNNGAPLPPTPETVIAIALRSAYPCDPSLLKD
jgi:hypothetical protein